MGLDAEPGQVKGRVVGGAGRSAWPRQVAGVGSDHEKRRWGRQQELDLRRHVEEFGLDLECSGELWGTQALGRLSGMCILERSQCCSVERRLQQEERQGLLH